MDFSVLFFNNSDDEKLLFHFKSWLDSLINAKIFEISSSCLIGL